MAIVKTREDQDQALESLAPAFLRGRNKGQSRVEWALDEFIASQQSGKDGEAKKNKPQPAGTEA